ncbi:MAG: hypothetical protein JWP22_2923 [Ramlibacter sp.]|nr:hypothetical protein [Ramlibacter sp.]MDB5914248.1 hypothetical protein [Ramlibacter sp.]
MKKTLIFAAISFLLAGGVLAQGANTTAGSNSNSVANQNAVSGSRASTENSGNSSLSNVGNTGGQSAANSNAQANTSSTAGSSGNNTNITFTSAPPPTATRQSLDQALSGGTSNTNRNINEGTSTVNQNLTGQTTQNVNQQLSGQTTSIVRSEASGTTTQNQSINHSGTVTNVNRIEGESTQRIEQHIEYSGTQTIKNVPSVNGPPLTTSNDTCMGSTSGSINGPGFGIGIGSTWTDRNCVMLKNARELWNMGMKLAAMALFCTDDTNRNALEITGFICPQTAARQRAEGESQRVSSEAGERAALKRRVAELEATQKGAVAPSRGWLSRHSSSGEVGTPMPEPAMEQVALPVPVPVPAPVPAAAMVAVPAVSAPIEVVAAPPTAAEALASASSRRDGAAAPSSNEASAVIRLVSEPAR